MGAMALRSSGRPGIPDAPCRLVDPVTDSNCYLIRQGKQCVLIDPNAFSVIKPVLQKWNISCLLVLLTHEHCDHIGGLNELRANYHTIVAASSACSTGMQNARENMSRQMELFLYFKNGQTKITPYRPFTCRAADIQFGDEIRLRDFSMKALPGHTHGSSVILYEGAVFCGDYLLPEDKVVTRLPGGSDEEYERFAKPWLRQIPDGTWIFPGHGEPFLMNQEVRCLHDL